MQPASNPARARTVLTALFTLLLLRCGEDEFLPDSAAGSAGATQILSGGAAGESEVSPVAGRTTSSAGNPGAVGVGGAGGESGEGGAGISGEGGDGGQRETPDEVGGFGGSGGNGAEPDSGGSGAAGEAGAPILIPRMGPGDSCSDPLVISETTLIEGGNFAFDFADDHDFAGQDCALADPHSPEAVFAVNVPAQATVLLREHGRIDAIDALLNLTPSCEDEAACVASRSDRAGRVSLLGVSYTAEVDETLFASVGTVGNPEGSYRISVEYPERMGRFGAGSGGHTVDGTALPSSRWRTYEVDISEPAILSADLTRKGNKGDMDLLFFNGQNLLISERVGDESRAFRVFPGRHFIETLAYDAVDGYTLEWSTDPFMVVTVPIDQAEYTQAETPTIPAGGSFYYVFGVTVASLVTVSLDASAGDPSFIIYDGDGALAGTHDTDGESESYTLSLGNRTTIGLRVRAKPGAGEIPSHEIRVSASPE